ncbi:hypothetical protein MPER_02251 [Moniliophthora perniciosa FA553]|nr:hypothetical protein MPER_02251 [Moniliophthora perniciosa FA553]
MQSCSGESPYQAISGGVIHVHGPAVQALEHTISDEFEYVKLGHIIGVEDLGSVDLSEWDWDWKNGVLARQRRKSARKTVSSVNIHPDRQSKFTVFTYEGDDANQTWNRDFQQFSHAGFVSTSLESKLLLIGS